MQEACIPAQVSSQSEELDVRMSAQVSLQLKEEVKGSLQSEEQEACIPAEVEEQDKIEPETDDSLEEGPKLEGLMHEVELNQCTTSGEINSESSVAKAYWAERSSLKLVCGSLH